MDREIKMYQRKKEKKGKERGKILQKTIGHRKNTTQTKFPRNLQLCKQTKYIYTYIHIDIHI